MNGWVWEIAYPLWVKVSYALSFEGFFKYEYNVLQNKSSLCTDSCNLQNIVAGANLL